MSFWEYNCYYYFFPFYALHVGRTLQMKKTWIDTGSKLIFAAMHINIGVVPYQANFKEKVTIEEIVICIYAHIVLIYPALQKVKIQW